MTTSKILGVLTLSTAVAILGGCGQQGSTPAASSDAAKPATPAAAAAPAAPATPPATDAAAASSSRATEPAGAAQATAAAQQAATDTSSQAQGLIDKAKSMIDSGQYPEASKLLTELSSMQLTPDQQKMVDDLKTLVQQKLAGSSLGGLVK